MRSSRLAANLRSMQRQELCRRSGSSERRSCCGRQICGQESRAHSVAAGDFNIRPFCFLLQICIPRVLLQCLHTPDVLTKSAVELIYKRGIHGLHGFRWARGQRLYANLVERNMAALCLDHTASATLGAGFCSCIPRTGPYSLLYDARCMVHNLRLHSQSTCDPV